MNRKLLLLFVGCVVVLSQCQSRSPDEKAIEDLSQAIRLNPDNAVAYYNRGLTYGDSGQYQRAIEDYSQAIRLDPDYTAAYNNRGNAYDDLGQREKALLDWRKACDLGYQPACEKVK